MIVSFLNLNCANDFRESSTHLPSGDIPQNRKAINEYIRPQNCPICHKSNHSNSNAFECDKIPRCPRCCSVEHTSPSNCKDTCWSCGEGHISSSTRCPQNRAYVRKVRIERRNAQSQNTLNNSAYNELKNEIEKLKKDLNNEINIVQINKLIYNNAFVAACRSEMIIENSFQNVYQEFLTANDVPIIEYPTPHRAIIETYADIPEKQTESTPMPSPSLSLNNSLLSVSASEIEILSQPRSPPETPKKTPSYLNSNIQNSPNYDSSAETDFHKVFKIDQDELKITPPKIKPNSQAINKLKQSIKQTDKYPSTIVVKKFQNRLDKISNSMDLYKLLKNPKATHSIKFINYLIMKNLIEFYPNKTRHVPFKHLDATAIKLITSLNSPDDDLNNFSYYVEYN